MADFLQSYSNSEAEIQVPFVTHPGSNTSGYSWVRTFNSGSIPHNAFEAGRDSDGSLMYVGKTIFRGEQLPCKIIPQKRKAYVSYCGKEHSVSSYETLCQHQLKWVPSSNGFVPAGAMQGGRTSSGETLYIGRASHDNSQTVGKIHPSHHCLYIPYGGSEMTHTTYETLVYEYN